MNHRTGIYLRRATAALVLLVTMRVTGESPARVVAIGDVHGAYPEFVSILQQAVLVDGNLNWSGGTAILVQAGDVLDRGAESRKALDLLMKLEAQAEQQHGKVVALLGNHEVMDMMGDLRYVSAGEYQAFATDQSQKVREQAYQEYRKFMAEQGASLSGSNGEADREKWMTEHPLGFFELREAYGPKGQYGSWFRKHDAVAQVGDAVFLHGGLNPDIHFRDIQELNKRIHSEISTFDSLWKALSDGKVIWRYMTLEEAVHEIQNKLKAAQAGSMTIFPNAQENMAKLLRGIPTWLIVSPEGPLWYRGLAQDPEAKLQSKLEQMLARLKVSHIVMGHTVVSRQAITPRFNDHVFLIDTGMLTSYFQGRASALEIKDGRYTAIYSNGDQQVLLGPKDGQTVPALGRGAAIGKQQP